MNPAMYSSKSNEWTTPQGFFDTLDKEFQFTLDPASTHENAKCEKHYTVEENGLTQDWSGETVFCNPPYGRELGRWVKKCYEEGLKPNTTVVMLIPSRTDTKSFHDYILGKAEIRFIKGRLRFGGSTNGAPFPSVVVIYRGTACTDAGYIKSKYLEG